MLQGLLPRRLSRLFSRPIDEMPAAVSGGPQLTAISPEQMRFFHDEGYLILPGFFPADVVAGLKRHLDHLWEHRGEQARAVIDVHFGQPNAYRTHFRKTRIEDRQDPYKILDLHLDDAVIRDISADARLLAVVHDLLGAKPLVINSLLFEWGSQQEAHFDTFFMPSQTSNMMAASWVAIDPVTATNGPLYYYPKSHLIEPFTFSNGSIKAVLPELQTDAARHIDRIVQVHGLKRELFQPAAGDVLIWHAQLLHGGSPIINPRETRRSLVTHYWTEVDFPHESQRIEIDGGRWLLKREPQYAVDAEILAEIDVFLATLDRSAEACAGVPDNFDPRMYLAHNQDVLRAGASPWQHFRDHGKAEGRLW